MVNYKNVTRHLKKPNLKSSCPMYIINQLMFKMLTRGMLFAWKNSATHTKFYAYHQSFTFCKGTTVQKSSKMKVFIIIVSALKTCCCYS